MIPALNITEQDMAKACEIFADAVKEVATDVGVQV